MDEYEYRTLSSGKVVRVSVPVSKSAKSPSAKPEKKPRTPGRTPVPDRRGRTFSETSAVPIPPPIVNSSLPAPTDLLDSLAPATQPLSPAQPAKSAQLVKSAKPVDLHSSQFTQTLLDDLLSLSPTSSFTGAAEILYPTSSSSTYSEWIVRNLPTHFPIPLGPHQRFISDSLQITPYGLRLACGAPRGAGKALEISTPIPTPSGWVQMGDIEPGDVVFDHAGHPVKVLAISHIEQRESYEVCFSAGNSIIASDDHLWTVFQRKDLRTFAYRESEFSEDWPSWSSPGGSSVTTLTTREMLNLGVLEGREHRFAIPLAGILDLPETNLPIDPYLLGLWLGNGSKSDSRITMNALDAEETVQILASRGVSARSRPPSRGSSTIYVDGLKVRLRDLGLLRNKHVPPAYLRAEEDQRRALLAGLLDTDATPARSGAEFSSSTEALADGVHELAASLSLKVSRSIRRAKLNGKDYGPHWRVSVSGDNFWLSRKQPRQKKMSWIHKLNYIRSIIPVGKKFVKCIYVDSPDHLYLAGRAMIPTHNTAFTFIGLPLASLALGTHRFIAMVGATQDEAEARLRIIRTTLETNPQLAESFPRLRYVPKPRSSRKHNVDTQKEIQLVGGRIIAVGAESKIRGLVREDEEGHLIRPDLVLVDDCESEDQARSVKRTDRLEEWLFAAVSGLGSISTAPGQHQLSIIMINTVLSAGCLMDRALKSRGRFSSWTTRAFPLYSRDPATGQPLSLFWPEFYSWPIVKNLTDPQSETFVGPFSFSREYLLDPQDVPDVYWTESLISASRHEEELPELTRIVVAVDPSWGTKNDECGIIIAGKDSLGTVYIIDDFSDRMVPAKWGQIATEAFHNFRADKLVVEAAFGAEDVSFVLTSIDPTVPVTPVRVYRGKERRIEPIVDFFRRGKIKLAGSFPPLEYQMLNWNERESYSPDRIDAMVWAAAELLMNASLSPAAVFSPPTNRISRSSPTIPTPAIPRPNLRVVGA